MQAAATTAYVLVCTGGAWLGVMLLRRTHDATAFTLYGALAVPREREAPGHNLLWAPLSWLRRTPRGRSQTIAAGIWPLAIVSAWLVERQLWRRNSPLRQSLPLC